MSCENAIQFVYKHPQPTWKNIYTLRIRTTGFGILILLLPSEIKLLLNALNWKGTKLYYL